MEPRGFRGVVNQGAGFGDVAFGVRVREPLTETVDQRPGVRGVHPDAPAPFLAKPVVLLREELGSSDDGVRVI
jgi:hypothetical protein